MQGLAGHNDEFTSFRGSGEPVQNLSRGDIFRFTC